MTGIKKDNPLYCKRCGKKVGWVTLKPRFKVKMFLIGFVILFFLQLVTEWIVNYLLFGGADRLLQ